MNKFTKLTAVCFYILAAFGAGCASDDYKSTKNRASAADTKAETHYYGQSVVFNYSKGSSILNESAKERLRSVVSTIGADNIKRVEIASWSDKAFPKAGPNLPKVDRDLADERAGRIDDFLKDELNLSIWRVRTYSMAETSNWLARALRTDESELKSVFSKEVETPMAREDFNVIMEEGGPSKVVVVFIRK